MSETRIFDGAHLRAYLSHPDRSKLYVTFDHRKVGARDFAVYAPSKQALKNGFAHLKITTCQNDWYLNDDTQDLQRILTGLGQRYDSVHIMGFSMGAYGGFRFAKALNATSLVAVSPQFSVDPAMVPFDHRYRADIKGLDHSMGNLLSVPHDQLRGLILTDPFHKLDFMHATMLQMVYPNMDIVRLSFGDHPAGLVLRQGGGFAQLQKQAFRNDPEALEIIHAYRAARRSSRRYWTTRRNALKTRWPALAAQAQENLDKLEAQTGNAG
ncbi:alpha/beta hydrolase [Aestuariibius sp. HNIBRBA575]|uniref:alpha/beta hydrolase n=1 Tax=Aestuariibius sp. HNIBRBA575 TaxID=3233343 RepID=UPI0034A29076